MTESAWNPRMFDGIHVEQSEFKSVCGGTFPMSEYCYMDKRGKQASDWNPVKPHQYEKSAMLFEKLIRPDQPEEDKHTNFYKAALLLIQIGKRPNGHSHRLNKSEVKAYRTTARRCIVHALRQRSVGS
jgi:hypothetical protein